MVYGDTQTSGKRERLIYAHIDRALAHKHIQFALDHQNDSLEQLAAYLRLLLKIGFLNEKKRPIVSFEIKPFGEEDPEVCLANAKRTLDLAWELV